MEASAKGAKEVGGSMVLTGSSFLKYPAILLAIKSANQHFQNTTRTESKR
jgi:hypothetical protein